MNLTLGLTAVALHPGLDLVAVFVRIGVDWWPDRLPHGLVGRPRALSRTEYMARYRGIRQDQHRVVRSSFFLPASS